MKSIENEQNNPTTDALLEDAIEGIRGKISHLHIVAYRLKTTDGLGKVVAAQSEIIQNAINTLKEIKGRL